MRGATIGIRRRFLGAALVGALALPGLGFAAQVALAPSLRLVVAGGDLTEIVFALGAGDQVVGVDQTSTWPPEATSREQIGYVRRLAPEGVLSLAPDLVIAAHDAGPEIAIEQLAAAGVAVARAPHAESAADIPLKIAFVGEAVGREAEAEALAARFSDDLAVVRAKVETIEGAPRVLFVLSISNGAPLVGGTGTTADRMIALAGGVNAAAGVSDWKPMSREAIISAAPDVILMMRQHATRVGGIEAIMARPEIQLTPAGRAGRGVTMDGMLLLGFGPRTPAAIAELARALHAERAIAAGL